MQLPRREVSKQANKVFLILEQSENVPQSGLSGEDHLGSFLIALRKGEYGQIYAHMCILVPSEI